MRLSKTKKGELKGGRLLASVYQESIPMLILRNLTKRRFVVFFFPLLIILSIPHP
jgi:hypothetical protein